MGCEDLSRRAHPSLYPAQAAAPPGLGMMGVPGGPPPPGGPCTRKETAGENDPPICQPSPLPPWLKWPSPPRHSPSSCRGRKRNRESGEKGSCEQSTLPPHANPPPSLPWPASPPLTEFPLGLAHGPRTPGPLEETVGGPRGEARWHTAPDTLCDIPHPAHVPPNRPEEPQSLAESW